MVEQSTVDREQEAKENLLTKEVSGFGIRTELGMMAGGYGTLGRIATFLTEQPVDEKTTRNHLDIFLNKEGYKDVNTTPLQKFSTHERDNYAIENNIDTGEQYRLWETWMDGWIGEGGKPQMGDLYKDRIAGLSALGIQREAIRTWHSQTEDARKDIIAGLHTRYFLGDTNIPDLTRDLIESARGANNLIPITTLTSRLNAMEPFLASCGTGSKDAIKQHIFMQGVARSEDQKAKNALIEIAPKKLDEDKYKPTKEQTDMLKNLRARAYSLYPTADQQAPGATLPRKTPIDSTLPADQTGGRTRTDQPKTPAYQYNVYPSPALSARPTSQAEIGAGHPHTQESNIHHEDIITLSDPKRAVRQMQREIKKSKEDEITFGISPEILKRIVEKTELKYGAKIKTDIVIESGENGENQLVLSGMIGIPVVGKLIEFDINLQNDRDGLAISKREISYFGRLAGEGKDVKENRAMVESKLDQLNESIRNAMSKELGGNISIERFNVGEGVLICKVRRQS